MGVVMAAEVLGFWFGELTPDDWFDGGADIDARIRDRLSESYHAAAEGALDAWADTSDGALALLILLDQVPRNLFRGDALAFATDARAQALASRAVARAQDLEQPVQRRLFFYLPFEHAEEIVLQDCCVALVAERIGAGRHLEYAERHREVIRRFGRFPHRNAILGRACTAAEREYLDQPGAGF
ncbi:DUF924 family protein [Nitrospirillum sp. BR 11164]|uniref:DUF924 family protein n=1 Tax=Nitrospirillum sp. BR 11164 TaxID=3104324 RepID=UPI002AFE4FC9|nr:DUF924 family protein [Nitrospirillum sp. BR 11164]MEA1650253.1 DUF924 family protein [Nitrospirillum sp. BR 11164]